TGHLPWPRRAARGHGRRRRGRRRQRHPNRPPARHGRTPRARPGGARRRARRRWSAPGAERRHADRTGPPAAQVPRHRPELRSPPMTMGKAFDTHGPIGPWLVTADEIGDPHALRLQTWVNGELRQDAKTDDLIFDCYEQVEHLSTAFTLEPGDVIATGTPAGVGIAMKPPQLLRAGDVVRIEIEGVGVLENPVIDEPSDTATGLD